MKPASILLLVSSVAACAYDVATLPLAPDAGLTEFTPAPPDSPDAGRYAPVRREDLVGTWRNCSADTTYAADGTWVRVDARTRCTVRGTWSWTEGERLDLAPTETTCDHPLPPPKRGIVVQVPTDQLLLLHPGYESGYDRWYRDTLPHERWLVEGPSVEGNSPNGQTILRRVGLPGRIGTGCYWSADLRCGGVLSCGGAVANWQESETGLVKAGLGCSGDCPCGSVMTVQRTSATTGAGTFHAANCNGEWSGVIRVTVVPDE